MIAKTTFLVVAFVALSLPAMQEVECQNPIKFYNSIEKLLKAENGDREQVAALITRALKKHGTAIIVDEYDNSTLQIACLCGNEAMVDVLLRAGKNAILYTLREMLLWQRKNQTTALHMACYAGHEKCAALLFEAAKNYPVNNIIQELLLAQNGQGFTALHWACDSTNAGCVQLLIDQASKLDNPEVLTMMLSKKTRKGNTALHILSLVKQTNYSIACADILKNYY